MKEPKVCVLMSTYNGEKYLREQIDSILKQTQVDAQLIVRDDGSSDGTVRILEEYSRNYPNVSFYQGTNVGVGKSFLELLKNAPQADYYSFADQDDVWLEDKLNHAVSIIRQIEQKDTTGLRGEKYVITGLKREELLDSDHTSSVPVLYGSNQTLVDAELVEIGRHYQKPPKCDLYNCMSRNCFYGCTMVLNCALRDIYLTLPEPSEKVLARKNHDGWILYCALINGIVVYEHSSRILYRQHANNVVGGKKLRGLSLYKDKWNRLVSGKNKGLRSELAKDLITCYEGALDEKTLHDLMILSDANSVNGIIKLLQNREIVDSFNEKEVFIFLRGMLRWI